MHTKRIASGGGKEYKWRVTVKPGRHQRNDSITLLNVVRDILKYADSYREARKVISDGLILVDREPVRDYQFGVGLMDVVEIPKLNLRFRVLPRSKGLYLKDISEKEAGMKLCKIVDKSTLRGGRIQLNLHDGSNILVDEKMSAKKPFPLKVNDTLVVELPGRKVIESIEFKKGNTGMVMGGRHKGEVNTINDVLEGSVTRKSLTTIGGFQTPTIYIFAVGEKEPKISV